MSRVLVYDEVFNLPTPEAFNHAKRILLERIQWLVDLGYVSSACIIGSVALDEPSRESDLDVVIIHNFFIDRRDGYDALKEILRSVERETGVPIQPIVISREDAENGIHSLTNSLLEHIRSIPQEENSVGTNVLEMIRPQGDDPLLDLESYISHKLNGLYARDFSSNPSMNRDGLKDTFDTPIHVARRVLQIFKHEGMFHMSSDYNDSKSDVIANFLRLLEERNDPRLREGVYANVGSQFRELVGYRQAYSQLLSHVIDGSCSREEYDARIDLLGSTCTPTTIELLSNMRDFALTTVQETREDRERELLEQRITQRSWLL